MLNRIQASKNKEYIDNYFNQMQQVINNINKNDIDKVIELLFESWKEDRTVFIMGNGGSASTATHFVCDLAKCTIVDGKKRFKVIGLTDNIPWVSALTNDNVFESIFEEQLKNLMRDGDILIGISVHGGKGKDKAGLWSQNLLRAMEYVKKRRGKNIAFSGFDGGAMKEIADVCIVVPFNSTPQVESFHVVLEHLICDCLAEKIEDFDESTSN